MAPLEFMQRLSALIPGIGLIDTNLLLCYRSARSKRAFSLPHSLDHLKFENNIFTVFHDCLAPRGFGRVQVIISFQQNDYFRISFLV